MGSFKYICYFHLGGFDFNLVTKPLNEQKKISHLRLLSYKAIERTTKKISHLRLLCYANIIRGQFVATLF